MRDRLAERLLAEVMAWETDDVARERPILQSMAKFKYDAYQKFTPGMRFIESLALWLGQFEELEQRKVAFNFVRNQLIFISNEEMNHFVEMAYPDYILPKLIEKVGRETGADIWKVAKIVESNSFRIAQRKTLILGLSDGSRIDLFRRSNPQLTHEQIYLTYEVADERSDSLLKKLVADVSAMQAITLNDVPKNDTQHFETVVLLDDFSGSGISYLRQEPECLPDGKVVKFFNNVFDPAKSISKLIDPNKTEFILVLYIATEQARAHFTSMVGEALGERAARFRVLVVNQLSDSIRLASDRSCPFNALIETHYDEALEDKHTNIGGDGVRFGFGKCGLPLVLPHNTPNNSVALLWGSTSKLRPLFPRVSRHK